MMKSIRIILAPAVALALVVALVVPGAARQQVLAEPAEPEQESFLIGASDIPLMPGLTHNEAATVLFDKPAGRILIASPGGCVNSQDAQRFYGTTLPQLGWLPAQAAAVKLTYLREGERLTLEFSEDGDCVSMRFLLSPVLPDQGEQ